MIRRYQMEMVEGGLYDDAEWVKYSDYIELEAELFYALKRIDELESDIQEYVNAQTPI